VQRSVKTKTHTVRSKAPFRPSASTRSVWTELNSALNYTQVLSDAVMQYTLCVKSLQQSHSCFSRFVAMLLVRAMSTELYTELIYRPIIMRKLGLPTDCLRCLVMDYINSRFSVITKLLACVTRQTHSSNCGIGGRWLQKDRCNCLQLPPLTLCQA